MWKFPDNICGRQSNIFSKIFFIVIELHERNQPTKFYLGNINITCFIKVYANFWYLYPRPAQYLMHSRSPYCLNVYLLSPTIRYLYLNVIPGAYFPKKYQKLWKNANLSIISMSTPVSLFWTPNPIVLTQIVTIS